MSKFPLKAARLSARDGFPSLAACQTDSISTGRLPTQACRPESLKYALRLTQSCDNAVQKCALAGSPRTNWMFRLAFLFLITPRITADVSRTPTADLLSRYLAQLATLSSVHLEATYEIRGYKVDTNTPVAVNKGHYEFWAEREKYRISIKPSSKHNKIHYDVAYDGTKYAWFNQRSKYMLFSTNNMSTNPMTIPNPLLMPVDFLSQDSDSCPACLLQFAQAKDPTMFESVHPLNLSTNAAGHLTIDLRGGSIDSRPFFWRVVFSSSASIIPIEIQRVSTTGPDLISSLSFPESMSSPTGKLWPKRIRLVGFSAAQQPVVDMTVDVYTVDENVSCPASVFSLDSSEAKIVVNGDTGEFLRTRRTYTPRPLLMITLWFLGLLPLVFLFRKHESHSEL